MVLKHHLMAGLLRKQQKANQMWKILANWNSTEIGSIRKTDNTFITSHAETKQTLLKTHRPRVYVWPNSLVQRNEMRHIHLHLSARWIVAYIQQKTMSSWHSARRIEGVQWAGDIFEPGQHLSGLSSIRIWAPSLKRRKSNCHTETR